MINGIRANPASNNAGDNFATSNGHLAPSAFSYEEAVSKLNSLQSNAQVLAQARGDQRRQMSQSNVAETKKFLLYLGIESDADIDRLNCIHVAGTKGKGSTCAFVESLLRHAGFKTGFYSSPHLVHVRERIRINGEPISEELFAESFFHVYGKVQGAKPPNEDMPAYFKFLTLLAFHIFLREQVDVAIVEVGIGGENDCTNVIARPVVCGITSLDYDHTRLLGHTLEEIAWQKAGIMKRGSRCMTVEQSPGAYRVIEERSIERECPLSVVPDLDDYEWPIARTRVRFGIAGRHQNTNISLALQLARHWLITTGRLRQRPVDEELANLARSHKADHDAAFKVPRVFLQALEQCEWPGRSQILDKGRLKYFLDCAHTPQSIKYCAEWFSDTSRQQQPHTAGLPPTRILLFHCTGDRKSSTLLPALKSCNFDAALFCPTLLKSQLDMHDDSANLNQDAVEETRKCAADSEIWAELTEGKIPSRTFACIEQAVEHLRTTAENNAHPGAGVYVLVTVLYNVIAIPILAFDQFAGQYYSRWLVGNFLTDAVFIADVLQLWRTKRGSTGNNAGALRDSYYRSLLLGAVAVVPADLALFYWPRASPLRLNRLLKVGRLVEYADSMEMRSAHSHLLRLAKLLTICFVIFHWNGCLYFLLSTIYTLEDAGPSDWIYSDSKIPDLLYPADCDPRFPLSHTIISTTMNESIVAACLFDESVWPGGWRSRENHLKELFQHWKGRVRSTRFNNLTRQYGQSFYWSALTLVTLGEQPWPNNSVEAVFEIGCTIFGIVMFAAIIGGIGNMVTNMNSAKTTFEALIDGCRQYMRFRRVGSLMETRVVNWLEYYWNEGADTVDEGKLLAVLPVRLGRDLALHAHLDVLRGVPLFKGCEVGLLEEVAMKLKEQSFSPGDYVFRRGEVGKEMYVVKSGRLEVLTEGDDERSLRVLSTLSAGSVFGELSILGICNKSRRTASVRSVGYSNLYCLRKSDLLSLHPDYKKKLIARGLKLLAGDRNTSKSPPTGTVHDEIGIGEQLPVEERLLVVQAEVEKLTKCVDEFEQLFKNSTTRLKHSLSGVENRYKKLMRRTVREMEGSGKPD